MDTINEYFKDFLDDDDLYHYLKPRLFTRELLLDDPIDFINGFNLALAYAYKAQIHDHDEEVKFRISLALWLRKQIESLEKLDWQ